jgi:hypothetical protein
MFNSPPRLSIRRPSPTTALFTVSNAPSRSTISSRIFFYSGLLFRCIIGLCVLLIDAAKGRSGVFFQDDSLAWDLLWETPPGRMACSAADQIDWRVLAIGSSILIYLVFRKGYTGQLGPFPIALTDMFWIAQLTRFRGIAAGSTRFGNRDFYILPELFVNRNDQIHSNYFDSRHCHSRGLQGLRG